MRRLAAQRVPLAVMAKRTLMQTPQLRAMIALSARSLQLQQSFATLARLDGLMMTPAQLHRVQHVCAASTTRSQADSEAVNSVLQVVTHQYMQVLVWTRARFAPKDSLPQTGQQRAHPAPLGLPIKILIHPLLAPSVQTAPLRAVAVHSASGAYKV